jgi:hypothetical protein
MGECLGHLKKRSLAEGLAHRTVINHDRKEGGVMIYIKAKDEKRRIYEVKQEF